MKHDEIKRRDDTQQTRYITWLGQKIDKSQKLILQLFSGNDGKKMKEKVETCHSAKQRLRSLPVLKLITQKRMKKKIIARKMENRSPKQLNRQDQQNL